MLIALLISGLFGAAPALAREPAADQLQPCRLDGFEHDAWCGQVSRALDPARPDGIHIDVHFAVLPALARNKLPDPVFFFAGGPGQSAIALAGPVAGLLGRLRNRRDIVLIDQRGTGRSAPLQCTERAATAPLRETVPEAAQLALLHACRTQLQALPYGDLRQFTTPIAMQDADAVRRALGAARINLVGASYGTRAALDYMRQFPHAVRRVVLDGVVPPDMVLPASFALDAQAALDALLQSCALDARCSKHYPSLRAQWQTLLASLPREVRVAQPVTGHEEVLTLTRGMLAGLLRLPLYVPALASALPYAISEAAQGRVGALFGLASALGSGRASALAQGMHFSVICAEDMPRLAAPTASAALPQTDFGDAFATLYRQVCADWPHASLPAAFHTLPPAPVATLLLSGGIDPAAPPRHAAHVAQALGAKTRSVVVSEAGHGVMAIACMHEVVFRFIDATSDAAALRTDAACAQRMPRPGAFVPLAPEVLR